MHSKPLFNSMRDERHVKNGICSIAITASASPSISRSTGRTRRGGESTPQVGAGHEGGAGEWRGRGTVCNVFSMVLATANLFFRRPKGPIT